MEFKRCGKNGQKYWTEWFSLSLLKIWAELYLIKLIGKHYSQSELKLLQRKISPETWTIAKPFVENGIRLCGRLKLANAECENKGRQLDPLNKIMFAASIFMRVHPLSGRRLWTLSAGNAFRRQLRTCVFLLSFQAEKRHVLQQGIWLFDE